MGNTMESITMQDKRCNQTLNSTGAVGKGWYRVSKRRAQASLEVTLSLICVTILLFGAIGIFIWLTENITRRQEDFEASRVEAGDINPGQEGVYLDESNYSKLNLFGESQ